MIAEVYEPGHAAILDLGTLSALSKRYGCLCGSKITDENKILILIDEQLELKHPDRYRVRCLTCGPKDIEYETL